MPSPPNVAVRKFALLWGASLAWKVGALVLLLFVVVKFLGGGL